MPVLMARGKDNVVTMHVLPVIKLVVIIDGLKKGTMSFLKDVFFCFSILFRNIFTSHVTSNHHFTLFALTFCLFPPQPKKHPDILLPASFPTWRLMHCEPCARLLLSRHTGCGDFNQWVNTENVSANKVSGLPRSKTYYHSLSQLKEGI